MRMMARMKLLASPWRAAASICLNSHLLGHWGGCADARLCFGLWQSHALHPMQPCCALLLAEDEAQQQLRQQREAVGTLRRLLLSFPAVRKELREVRHRSSLLPLQT